MSTARDEESQASPVDRLIEGLRGALSDGARIQRLLADRLLRARDLADPPPLLARGLRSVPEAVLGPGTPGDVAATLKRAAEAGVPVTPRGVASSGFGGAVPTRAGLSLDLSGFAALERLDRDAGTIDLQAGVRWADLIAHLDKRGLAPHTYPSSAFSTVAGWVATGGHGLHGWRYGHLREHVAALEAVFPGQEPRWLEPSDERFAPLFGSEGQLGVVTRVRLRLRPRPTAVLPAAFMFPTPVAAMAFVRGLAERALEPATVKLLDRGALAELTHFLEHERGVPSRALPGGEVVLLCFDEAEQRDRFEVQASALLQATDGQRVPHAQASFLWEDRLMPLKGRKLAPALLAAMVMVPLETAGDYLERARGLAERFGVRLAVDGHAVRTGERRELLVLATYASDKRRALGFLLHAGLAALLTRLGIAMGGRPYSAGLWNAGFAAEKAGGRGGFKALVALKRAVDPTGILNPGKLNPRGLLGLALRPLPFRLALLGLRAVSRVVRLKPEPLHYPDWPPDDPLLTTAEQCSRCGSCVSECPAYRVTGLEAVSPRAKLAVAARLLEGHELEPGAVESTFLCLHCGACEAVCQSTLPLVAAWDRLEALLAEARGFPAEAVGQFIDAVDRHPGYRASVHPAQSTRVAPALAPRPWRKPT